MILDAAYNDGTVFVEKASSYRGMLSVSGPRAKKLGVAKPNGEVTREERLQRLLSYETPIRRTSDDGSMYPKNIDLNQVFRDMVMKSESRHIELKGENIFNHPEAMWEEGLLYLDYCTKNKIGCSINGLATWYGVSTRHLGDLRKSDRPCAPVIEKVISLIGQMRVEMTDSGSMNPVWNMFMLANGHDYTRSDPKAALNIQINNQGYSDGELDTIIADLPLDDDF